MTECGAERVWALRSDKEALATGCTEVSAVGPRVPASLGGRARASPAS